MFNFWRDKPKTIEAFLLSQNYIIHDVINNGKTTVYNKNMQTIIVTFEKGKRETNKGNVLLDVNGKELFKIGYIPSLTIFEVLLKNSLRETKN